MGSTDSVPANAMAASAAASAACASWETITTGRLGSRSASAPPHMPSSSVGSACITRLSPTLAAEPVRVSTSQLTPSTCIQVPVMETRSAPAQRR